MSTPQEVWDAPIQDVTAPDPPAPSSEQVENAPAADAASQGEAQAQASNATPPADTSAAAQSLDWSTAPQAFREAHEAEKPLRELAKEVGGLDVLREAVEFDELMRNPTVDVGEKLQRLHSLSESEFQRIGSELLKRNWQDEAWQDHLLKERFGLTAAEIEGLKQGQGRPPQSPQPEFDAVAYAREVLADPLANEHDRRLAQFTIQQAEEARQRAEALAKLPNLEKEVGTLREKLQSGEQTATQAQRDTLAGELLTEGFAPVEEIIGKAFPAVPGETPQDAERRQFAANKLREEVFNELYAKALLNESHPNHALAKELDGYINNLDRPNALRKLPKIRALAEMAADKYASYLSSTYAQQRRDQSRPLEREPNPPVVNGQGSSFGSQDPIPAGREAWNDPNMGERWKEIADAVR